MKKRNRILIYLFVILGVLSAFINSCKKNDNNNNPKITGTMTDFDGNIYQTITIDKLEWMAENLKTTHYNNNVNVNIPKVTITSEWAGMTSDAYCWYNNDSITYSTKYGALYNWYAVNTGKLCPTGWHVPTDAEWTTLITFLGGEIEAGDNLKESGAIHWTNQNTGNNSSGFTALPGGDRTSLGDFYNVANRGYWWSATESNTPGIIGARYLYIFSNNSGIYGDDGYKNNGFSVRCVKVK